MSTECHSWCITAVFHLPAAVLQPCILKNKVLHEWGDCVLFRWSPNCHGLTWSSNFTMMQKWYEFSKNCTLNFKFGCFPGPVMCGRIFLWFWAVTVSHSSLLIMWSWVNHPYSYSHSAPMQLFCFSLGIIFNKLHEIVHTLYYKIHFVLDDFS